MFPLRKEMLLIFDQDLWDAVIAIETDPDMPIEALADLLNVKLDGDTTVAVEVAS